MSDEKEGTLQMQPSADLVLTRSRLPQATCSRSRFPAKLASAGRAWSTCRTRDITVSTDTIFETACARRSERRIDAQALARLDVLRIG
jgi:hypothetical protein